MGVTNIYVNLSNTSYPRNAYKLSFSRQDFSAASFRSEYYNIDEMVSKPIISPSDYKNLYPLFLFDVSKQSERVKYSSISIVIEASFQGNMNAGTIAYAVVISERLINFQSD